MKFFIKHFMDWKMVFTTFGLIIFLGFLGFLKSKAVNFLFLYFFLLFKNFTKFLQNKKGWIN